MRFGTAIRTDLRIEIFPYHKFCQYQFGYLCHNDSKVVKVAVDIVYSHFANFEMSSIILSASFTHLLGYIFPTRNLYDQNDILGIYRQYLLTYK